MLRRASKDFYYLCSMAKLKLPKDVNQRAVMIAQIATGEIEDTNKVKDNKKLAEGTKKRNISIKSKPTT